KAIALKTRVITYKAGSSLDAAASRARRSLLNPPSELRSSVLVGVPSAGRTACFLTARSSAASAERVAGSSPEPALDPCHSYLRVASRYLPRSRWIVAPSTRGVVAAQANRDASPASLLTIPCAVVR